MRKEMRQELARLSDRTVRVERLQRRARSIRKIGVDKLDALLRQDYLARRP